ncbi:MAG: TIGR00341 family protein [Chitinophagaceae bacterium]
MYRFLDKFRLRKDKEDLKNVIESIDSGIVFRGTNLWVLIFAIFVASLGLNVNSTAVIIGAMLISPLMGPIMGLGLGMGINDVSLLRRALNNYLIATGVALTTSTVFFLLSPLGDAHSELLARTSPNIYDVLIALFGGLAGIVATSSKQKGNVIPGVAIATALMPPLCTAGYGLATLQFNFFFGAFYLFIINTVFIALATFLIVRLLRFPSKDMQNPALQKRAQHIVWGVALVTLLPSLYFGYDLVQQDRFTKNVNRFITNEAHFTNDYLLNKKVDAKKKVISLVYGGKEIMADEIAFLKSKMKNYDLEKATLEVNQGFAYLSTENKGIENNEQVKGLTQALELREKDKLLLQQKFDSIEQQQLLGKQLFAELKSQYPSIHNAVIQPSSLLNDSSSTRAYLVLIDASTRFSRHDTAKLGNFLRTRLQRKDVKLVVQ